MYRLDVFQNQWLVVMMACGLVLVLSIVLYYVAMWRRRPDASGQAQSGAAAPKKPRLLPEVLILVYAFALVFMIVYTLFMIRYPPNW
jgi:ABC-type Fe3+ transport system permease subunit